MGPGRTRMLVGTLAALLTAGLVGGCTSSSAPHRTRMSSTAVTSSSSTAPTPSASRTDPPSRTKRRRTPRRLPVPTGGAVLQRVEIPSSDGFAPRPAYLYLPPSAVEHPDVRLPVLELLHGTPGGPPDWATLGGLVQTMDAFAAAHGGQAPIVVMPDLNGAQRADSECIRTAHGKNTESYLTRDVVGWVRSRYARTVGTERWWVAGLSEGGLCSLVLTLRHPHLYSALGDLSGLIAPLVEHRTRAESQKLLYTSRADELAHQPLWLLAHRDVRGVPAWFECGAGDRVVVPQQTRLVAAARSAGMVVRDSTAPGTHAWVVWRAALRSMLPWLWSLH